MRFTKSTKWAASIIFTEAKVSGVSPIDLAKVMKLSGVRGYWIRRHVERMAIDEEEANELRKQRCAAASARVANLPRYGDFAVEKGHFGSHGRSGYRIYKIGSSPYSATIVYSRDLPPGAGAKEAVEMATSPSGFVQQVALAAVPAPAAPPRRRA